MDWASWDGSNGQRLGAIQPTAFLQNAADPANLAALGEARAAQIRAQEKKSLGTAQMPAQRSVQLDQILDAPPLTQNGMPPHALEIEKEKTFAPLPGVRRHQNIRVLEVVMVDAIAVQRTKKRARV